MPPAQMAVPFAGVGQTLPHVPQLLGSPLTLVQMPEQQKPKQQVPLQQLVPLGQQLLPQLL